MYGSQLPYSVAIVKTVRASAHRHSAPLGWKERSRRGQGAAPRDPDPTVLFTSARAVSDLAKHECAALFCTFGDRETHLVGVTFGAIRGAVDR